MVVMKSKQLNPAALTKQTNRRQIDKTKKYDNPDSQRKKFDKSMLPEKITEFSLRKPKVFALQILQRYLTKEGRVRKFFHCLYG